MTDRNMIFSDYIDVKSFRPFNQDLSEWNIVRDINLGMMFSGSFIQTLACGGVWVNSKTNKIGYLY